MATKTLQEIKKEHFQGFFFSKKDNIAAGRILKKEDEFAAILFLKSKGKKEPLPNFRPPAKALIVGQSRPYKEWDICKASNAIQSYIYSISERDLIEPGKSKPEHDKWIKTNKIELGKYSAVQGLNLIIGHAYNTYKGVIKKVENRNKKARKKFDGENNKRLKNNLDPLVFEPELATNEDGKLLQPPGINGNIYCYQAISPKACKSLVDCKDIPSEYTGYYRDIKAPILHQKINRLAILEGEPGFVPEWQHSLLSAKENRRQRAYYSDHYHKPRKKRTTSKYSATELAQDKANDALLCKIDIGEDWVIFDARGLLRNLRWRKLVPPEGFSLTDILAQFTGDPVIDTVRNVITFIYTEKMATVVSKNIVSYKKAPELLRKLSENNDVGLISIDLGQTNLVSAKISKLSNSIPKLIDRKFLPVSLIDSLSGYRKRTDELENKINECALSSLNEEYQKEFSDIESQNTIALIKDRINKDFNIEIDNLPLDEMSNNTTFIADAYLKSNNDKSKITRINGSIIKDFSIVKDTKIKVSKNAREALNEKIWELKRENVGYKKLSQSKKEWARQCVNWIEKYAKEITKCEQIVFNIENLNVGIFNGSGKREIGFDSFFVAKKENRWAIPALHKAFSELAINRGLCVIESAAYRTSTTCTKCSFCNKNNRNGETFKCISCQFEANTDLEIATDNIEKVALSGECMPYPIDDCEQSCGTKTAVGARKGKKPNKITKIKSGANLQTLDDKETNIARNETARELFVNIA